MSNFNLALYQARKARHVTAHDGGGAGDTIMREYMFTQVRELGRSICDLATFPGGPVSALVSVGFIPSIAMDSTRTLHISIRSDGDTLFYVGFVQEGEATLHEIRTTAFPAIVDWAATTVAMFEYLPLNEPLPLSMPVQPAETSEPGERTRVIDLD